VYPRPPWRSEIGDAQRAPQNGEETRPRRRGRPPAAGAVLPPVAVAPPSANPRRLVVSPPRPPVPVDRRGWRKEDGGWVSTSSLSTARATRGRERGRGTHAWQHDRRCSDQRATHHQSAAGSPSAARPRGRGCVVRCGKPKKNQNTSDTRGRIGGFRTSVAHSANVRALRLRRLRRRPRQASPSGANAARGRAKSGSSAMPGKTPGKKICKSVFGSLIGRTQQRKNTVVRDIFPK
jgi:hypothetical protein